MSETGRAVRPGGRSATKRAAVTGATLGLLAERGIGGFGIEDVAAAAGVHKTTIYRRWGSLDELLVEAVGALVDQAVPVPDTGDTRADLGAFAGAVIALLNDPARGPLIRSLLSSGKASPQVREVIHEFWRARQRAIAPIALRGIERGDFPAGTDPARVMAQLGAPIYYRILVLGEDVDATDGTRAAAAAYAAARAGVFVAGKPPQG
ncbi:MAG: TetR/AcrR family transcriptional regulator [Tetrasphaera sp.]